MTRLPGRAVRGKSSGPPPRLWVGAALWLALSTGCASGTSWRPGDLFAKKVEPPPGPVDSYVLRGGKLEQVSASQGDPAMAELEGAHNLRKQEEHAKAGAIFHRLANNQKNTHNIIEEALFYEAECHYLQKDYREAEPLYQNCLKGFSRGKDSTWTFRYGRFQEQAAHRLYDIALYWLEPTIDQIQAYKEKREGKRWVVLPASYFHVSRDKPFLDMHGRALRALDAVALYDIKGPLGARAMFQIATVKMFHENYKDADFYYSQVYQHHPESPDAPKALKQAIICKQLMTGGSAYDTRVLQEAQQLIQASKSYPELANNEFLRRQLKSIGEQQADRDYNIAEFYRRTGHPGSAYFYYELVRRRYPNTDYARKADQRKQEMQARLDRQSAKPGAKKEEAPPIPPPPQPLPPTWTGPPSSLPGNFSGTPLPGPGMLPSPGIPFGPELNPPLPGPLPGADPGQAPPPGTPGRPPGF